MFRHLLALPIFLLALLHLPFTTANELTDSIADPNGPPYLILKFTYGIVPNGPQDFLIIDPLNTFHGNCTFPAVTGDTAPLELNVMQPCVPDHFGWYLTAWENAKSLEIKIVHTIVRTGADGVQKTLEKTAVVPIKDPDIPTGDVVAITTAAREDPATPGWVGDPVGT